MKSPAFQFYPNDFLGSGSVAAMTLEEVGAYWILLCYDWNEDGLPNDLERLARWCRVSRKRFDAIWSTIAENFHLVDDRWRNNRLEIERERQAENRKKRKHAADARWHPSDMPVDSTCNADAYEVECPSTSPSSASSPSVKTTAPDVSPKAASRRPGKAEPENPPSKSKPEPKYPHYPVELCQRLHAKWELEIGLIPYPAWRKRTAEVFNRPGFAESETPEIFEESIVVFWAMRDAEPEKERRWYTPERWWGDLPRLLDLARMPMVGPDGMPTAKYALAFAGH